MNRPWSCTARSVIDSGRARAGARLTAAIAEFAWAGTGNWVAIAKGAWSVQFMPGAPSHHWFPIPASWATHSRTRWTGVRATAAKGEFAWAGTGNWVAIAKGAWSVQFMPGAPSHHWL